MSEQEKILTPAIEQATPNTLATPERPATPEKVIEQPHSSDDQAIPVTSSATPISDKIKAIELSPEAQRVAEIEKILEDDLSEVYFNLSEDKRETFRVQGEATAREINTLLSATKIKINKIISLIRRWLLIIPGVNRFFLEQEAKLKADKILKFNEKI